MFTCISHLKSHKKKIEKNEMDTEHFTTNLYRIPY